jgi:hypothetical protein
MFVIGSEAVTRWICEFEFDNAAGPKFKNTMERKHHVNFYDDLKESVQFLCQFLLESI